MSWVITTKCRLYSIISQILLLYKIWWYYNKFDSRKSFGICYWYVKIPQCGYMENGLKHITFYVQKHIAALARCYTPGLVCDTPLKAPASVKLVYYLSRSEIKCCTWYTVSLLYCRRSIPKIPYHSFSCLILAKWFINASEKVIDDFSGLAPIHHQDIIQTSGDWLSIRPRYKYNVDIRIFSFKKCSQI